MTDPAPVPPQTPPEAPPPAKPGAAVWMIGLAGVAIILLLLFPVAV